MTPNWTFKWLILYDLNITLIFYFFKKIIFILCVCMSVCICVPGAGQKNVRSRETGVTEYVDAESWIWILYKSSKYSLVFSILTSLSFMYSVLADRAEVEFSND